MLRAGCSGLLQGAFDFGEGVEQAGLTATLKRVVNCGRGLLGDGLRVGDGCADRSGECGEIRVKLLQGFSGEHAVPFDWGLRLTAVAGGCYTVAIAMAKPSRSVPCQRTRRTVLRWPVPSFLTTFTRAPSWIRQAGPMMPQPPLRRRFQVIGMPTTTGVGASPRVHASGTVSGSSRRNLCATLAVS